MPVPLLQLSQINYIADSIGITQFDQSDNGRIFSDPDFNEARTTGQTLVQSKMRLRSGILRRDVRLWY